MINLKQIGAGNDKNVFLDANEPNKKVRVIFRKPITDQQVESIVCLNKIARLFFPGNIPEVYSANNHGESAVSVERTKHDSLHEKIAKLMIDHYKSPLGQKSILSDDDQNLLISLIRERGNDSRVLEFLHDTRDKGLIFDIAGQNFSIDESNGNVICMDVDPAWEFEKDGSVTMNFDKKKLLVAIPTLHKTSQAQARNYLNSLSALFGSSDEAKGKLIKTRKQVTSLDVE